MAQGHSTPEPHLRTALSPPLLSTWQEKRTGEAILLLEWKWEVAPELWLIQDREKVPELINVRRWKLRKRTSPEQAGEKWDILELKKSQGRAFSEISAKGHALADA